jgi:hypothetical protein
MSDFKPQKPYIERSDEMLNLNLVKIDKDLYVKGLGSYHYVNSTKTKPTSCNFYSYLKLVGVEKIEEIFELIPSKKIQKNYRLLDPILSDKFSEYLEFDEVFDPEFDKDEHVWKKEYENLKKYYVINYDTIPEHYTKLDFTIESYVEYSDIDFINGKYKVGNDSFISSDFLIRSEIDQFIFGKNNLVLSQLPCQISSEDMFHIISNYVKEHINLNYASIRYDSKYSFEIVRRVKLHTPIQSKIKQGRRLVNQTTTHKTLDTIYSINSEKSPLAPSFIANSEKALCDKIDSYLKDLIDFINSPLDECPTCKGIGHVEVKKFV